MFQAQVYGEKTYILCYIIFFLLIMCRQATNESCIFANNNKKGTIVAFPWHKWFCEPATN